MNESYDLIVIGAGSAGLTAASFGAQLGARVALVEKGRIGGDCTWTGCVPSKALLKVAKVAHSVRTASNYGLQSAGPATNMTSVRNYVRKAIHSVYQQETPDTLSEEGIEVVTGSARFVDPQTIRVGDTTLHGKKFVISTGAKPNVPPISGLEAIPYFTHEKLFDNDKLPERMIVLGAGPVGTEMSQAYQRLGSQVTVVDVGVLPGQDREAAAAVKRVLTREGVIFVTGLATAASQERGEIVVEAGAQHLRGDMLLVATGRLPNVRGLKLGKADVEFSEKGIEVDGSLRTSAKHVYAAGDVVGGLQYTHLAAWHGFVAARNALLPGNESGLDKMIPSTIFTDPEVAQVGLTESEARAKFGSEVRVSRLGSHRSDRAVCEDDLDGFLKVVHRPNGRILGVTIVSDRAGESITEFVVAMEHGLKLNDLATVLHVYPSYTMDAMRLASEVGMANLVSGFSGTMVRQLTRLALG